MNYRTAIGIKIAKAFCMLPAPWNQPKACATGATELFGVKTSLFKVVPQLYHDDTEGPANKSDNAKNPCIWADFGGFGIKVYSMCNKNNCVQQSETL